MYESNKRKYDDETPPKQNGTPRNVTPRNGNITPRNVTPENVTPRNVILLNISTKENEIEITNMFKSNGWQIYDHLYPYRCAAKFISHDQNYHERFVQFLSDQTCNMFHHPKDEFLMYSFFKWCRHHLRSSTDSVVVLGVHSEKEIMKFKQCGAKTVFDQEGGDFLILNVEHHRVSEISAYIEERGNFELTPHLQGKYDSIKRKSSNN